MARAQTKKSQTTEEPKLKMAVIPLAGQQFLVKEKEEFLVDYLKGKKSLKVRPYLVVSGKQVLVGQPEVKSYVCQLKVIEPEVKGEKKIVFKYRPKTGYHRKKGARPLYSLVRVEKIGKEKAKTK